MTGVQTTLRSKNEFGFVAVIETSSEPGNLWIGNSTLLDHST